MKKIFFFLFLSAKVFSQTVASDGIIASQAAYTGTFQTLLNYSINTAKGNTPSDYVKFQANLFIIAIAGLPTDVLHLKATDGSPVFTDLNVYNPGTNTAIRKNFPTWVRNNGFNYNGSSSYTDENWAPTNGSNYTQNSAEMVVGVTNVNTGGCHGGRNVGNFGTLIIPKNAASQALISCNSANATINDAQFDGTDGLYFVGRTSSTSMFGKHNSGTRIASLTASSPLSAITIKTGALDSNGAISLYASGNCLMFWAGGLLTTGQETTLLNAYNAYVTAIQSAPNPVLGTIFSANTFSSLAGFTTNGATAAIVSNAIQLTGGTGVYTKSLDYNYKTAQEYWTIKAQYNLPTINGSSTGLGVGIRSSSTNTKYDFVGWCSMTTGSVVARTVTVVNGTPNSASSTNTSGLTATANDNYQMIVTRAGNVFTISIQDLTTSSSIYTYSVTYPLTSANFLPNTGSFSLFNFGGTINVTSLTISSQTPTNANYCVMSDSKTVGYFAGTWGNQFAKLLGDNLIPGVVLGGGADESTDMLARINEVVALNPKIVIIAGASNDPRFGVPNSTTISNFASMNTTLTGAGLNVLWLTGFYETAGNNQTAIQSDITGTYPNYLDTLPNVISLNADGIHPDATGHPQIYNTLISSGKFTIH